jgi:nucleotide-binding universal stress UspA family protein
MDSIRRILVATDFLPCADAAAEVAAQLARQLHAQVELMTVIDTSGVTDASGEDKAPRRCRRLSARVRVEERDGPPWRSGSVSYRARLRLSRRPDMVRHA